MDMTPESKTERIHAAVTATEKRLVELVSTVERSTVSELLRTNSIEALIERGGRISERLREMETAA